MRTLYLGLRPKPGTFHYPVIRTEFCGDLRGIFALWDQFTHLIFTSQTTVDYWPGPWDKKAIAIGAATARALREKKVEPLIARSATQEGIIETIREIKGFFFLPCSSRARSRLKNYFLENSIPFFTTDLYHTVFQKLEPVPDLKNFDAIVFTSPSTVEGFIKIFGTLPKKQKLIAMGPITEKAIRDWYENV